MALWQYGFQLIEEKSLMDLSPANEFIEGESFNPEPFWVYSHKPKNFFTEISKIMPKSKSWCQEIDLYGMQDSHCLEVYFDDEGYVASASLRIDFRHPYEDILLKLTDFFVSKELAVIAENLYHLPPIFEQFDKTIQSSKQWTTYFWGM